MPQLIAIFVGIIVIGYAVVYLFAIAIYALIYAAIAGAVVWLVTMLAKLLIDMIEIRSHVSMSLASGQPRFYRVSERKRGSVAPALSILVGIAAGAAILLVMGANMQMGGGTDPAWVRNTGLGVAWLATACVGFWTYSSMGPAPPALQTEEIQGLTLAVDALFAAYYAALALATSRGDPLPGETWDFLAPAFVSASRFESVAARLLDERRAHYLQLADGLRQKPALRLVPARAKPVRVRATPPQPTPSPQPPLVAAPSFTMPLRTAAPSLRAPITVVPRKLELLSVRDALVMLGLPPNAKVPEVSRRISIFREIARNSKGPPEFSISFDKACRLLSDAGLIE